MAEPIDITCDFDAPSPWVEQWFELGLVDWVWIAPAFAAPPHHRLHRRGWRCSWEDHDVGQDAEDSIDPRWSRIVEFVERILCIGGFFFLVCPRDTGVWLSAELQRLLNHEAVKVHRVDWCAYGGSSSRFGSQGPECSNFWGIVRSLLPGARECRGALGG